MSRHHRQQQSLLYGDCLCPLSAEATAAAEVSTAYRISTHTSTADDLEKDSSSTDEYIDSSIWQAVSSMDNQTAAAALGDIQYQVATHNTQQQQEEWHWEWQSQQHTLLQHGGAFKAASRCPSACNSSLQMLHVMSTTPDDCYQTAGGAVTVHHLDAVHQQTVAAAVATDIWARRAAPLQHQPSWQTVSTLTAPLLCNSNNAQRSSPKQVTAAGAGAGALAGTKRSRSACKPPLQAAAAAACGPGGSSSEHGSAKRSRQQKISKDRHGGEINMLHQQVTALSSLNSNLKSRLSSLSHSHQQLLSRMSDVTAKWRKSVADYQQLQHHNFTLEQETATLRRQLMQQQQHHSMAVQQEALAFRQHLHCLPQQQQQQQQEEDFVSAQALHDMW